MEGPRGGTPLTQNLATLQRTHEVYRRARELAGGSEAAEPAANSEEGTPQRAASSGLRDHMERELAASVRQLRSVQAGQQVAAQHAAAEAAKLQATIRDERGEGRHSDYAMSTGGLTWTRREQYLIARGHDLIARRTKNI